MANPSSRPAAALQTVLPAAALQTVRPAPVAPGAPGARPGPGHPRGLLLDFGAVLSVSIFERHRETERILGLAEGRLDWLGPLDPDTDPLWRAMQRDEITERDYWAQRARELGEAAGEPGWDVRTMLGRIRQDDPVAVVRPQMTALVERAAARGIRLGILSNELELFYGRPFMDRMAVLSHFPVVVDATHTKILKPDPAAYKLAVEAMGLAAHEILFVDDQFRNVAGAVRAGLQVQWFDLRDVRGQIAAVEARLDIGIAMGSTDATPTPTPTPTPTQASRSSTP